MKILIFSDSHRHVEPMVTATMEEKPDQIIHLGDLETDAEELSRRFPAIPVANIAGNCDSFFGGERYRVITIRGKKLFITHGHPYGVKMGLEGLINTALTAGADVALFGHTHTPHFEEVNGMLVINPGSVGMGGRTYGVLTLDASGKMGYELKNV